MEHVPTLCALSTVGIAPIGLALGRPDQNIVQRPASNKRKAPGSSDGFRSFSSPLPRPPATPAGRDSSSNLHPSSSVRSRKGTANTIHTDPPVASGNTIPSWTPLQSGGHVRSSPLAEGPGPYPRLSRVPEGVGTSRRASASWLHRISTSSSIQDHSSRPTTPSISFSNRSSQPIFPSNLSTPASYEPNKLVKRTTSYSALRQTPTYTPTFKRPATSHQRSAEFRHQMALQEESELPDIGSGSIMEMKEPDEPTPTYRPYFNTDKSSGPSSQPRKRHTAGSTKTTPLKTIKSEVDELPTLLMATSIAPRTSGDDIDDTEDRPATRMRDDQNNRHSAKISPELDNEPKARSSLGEMFSSGTSGWRMSRSGSLRKKQAVPVESETVRHVSSPLMPPPSRGSKSGRTGSRLQRRRNITDPTLFKATKVPPHLDIGAATAGGSRDLFSSPLPPVSSVSAFEIDLPGGTPTFPKTPMAGMGPLSSHPPEGHGPSSTAAAQPTTISRSQQQKRISQAGSDPASTLVSDGDTRVFTSGDEDSMDFQSDTAYDSLATRATASSHSGLRGPRIETIFDESPPHGPTKAKLVPLEDLIQGGSFSERFSSKSSKPSVLEDSDIDAEFSTPVRDTIAHDERSLSEHIQSINEASIQVDFASSPPTMARRILEHRIPDDEMVMDEDEDWDADDRESDNDINELSPPLPTHSAHRFSPLALRPSPTASPEAYDNDKAMKRSSIFEWSEQQKHEKDALNGSSPRPKTVHGKQAKDGRGSRTTGRRGPSALHLRSQSVPVTRDSNAENVTPGGNVKFGTWGLGNKGVSEEWTDDFEFDEPDEEGFGLQDNTNDDPKAIGKGGMKVPQSIIDRQASVHVQFGQVQELSLLVEELKRLRAQAGGLNLLNGQSVSLWDEAEAIINLATVDEEEEGELRLPRSPASPTFGFDEFDDDLSATQRNPAVSSVVGEGNSRRNSGLRRSTSGPATPPATRPRGESTAQAKSFLQNMYQTRSTTDSSPEEVKHKGHDKVPFDTQDLRNLVTRAGVLTRALKDIVRKAEGVTQSPDNSPIPLRDPPFSQIFNPSIDESPTKKHHIPKSPSAHSYFRGSVSPNSETELSGHMKLMTVV